MVKHFERLPREKQSALPSPAYRRLIECITRVRLTDPRPLARLEGEWHTDASRSDAEGSAADLPRLSDAIAVSYFAHSTTSRAGGGPAAMNYRISHSTCTSTTNPSPCRTTRPA
jgi:hypothetical protein